MVQAELVDGAAGFGEHFRGHVHADYAAVGSDLVGGEDVPTALLDFARGVNATQLVIGTSRRSRLARTFADIANANPVPDTALRDIDLWTG